jgi:hypothetical protein
MGTTEIYLLGLIQFVGWIIVGIRLMNSCNVVGVSNGWLAFIPIGNMTRWARLAGANPWLVILFIIPIVGLILSLVWFSRMSEANGTKSPWFWVYVVSLIVAYIGGFALGGTGMIIVTIVGVLLGIAAQWMVFDPEKPIRREAPAAPAAA